MRKIFKFSLTGFLSQAQAEAGGKKCRALVLSGGANRGSYEIGAIKTLVPEGEAHWDVCSGVSGCSFVCSFVSGYEMGDEKKMAEDLVHLVHNFKTEMV